MSYSIGASAAVSAPAGVITNTSMPSTSIMLDVGIERLTLEARRDELVRHRDARLPGRGVVERRGRLRLGEPRRHHRAPAAMAAWACGLTECGVRMSRVRCSTDSDVVSDVVSVMFAPVVARTC